jgi:MFS family permease
MGGFGREDLHSAAAALLDMNGPSMSSPRLNQLTSICRRYTCFQFFFNLLLWVPIFYSVQRKMGLSDPQIFGIQSIYYIVFCALEIPTGFIADRFGYRFSMLLGASVLVIANLLPVVQPNYFGFLLHFLAIALARSLISGASSAYMYEYLQAQGEGDQYKKVEADARFYSLIGRIAAWTAVGWLMTWQLTAPYWLSAVNAAVALIIGFTMPTVAAKTDSNTDQSLGAYKKVLSGRLFLLMLQGVGIFVMVRILQVNLYQPILTARSFDITTFGWSMSLMTGFEALGSKAAPYLRSKIDDMRVVTLSTIFLGASLGLVAAFGQVGTLIGFCCFSFAAGVAFPVQKQLLNDAITDSRLRATVLSMESILDRACCAVAVLPLGSLVAAGRLDDILWVTGAIAAVVALGLQRAMWRYARPVPS